MKQQFIEGEDGIKEDTATFPLTVMLKEEITEHQNMVGAWLCDYAKNLYLFDEIKHRHTLKDVGDVVEDKYNNWEISRIPSGINL